SGFGFRSGLKVLIYKQGRQLDAVLKSTARVVASFGDAKKYVFGTMIFDARGNRWLIIPVAEHLRARWERPQFQQASRLRIQGAQEFAALRRGVLHRGCFTF